jgi:hypothetical protein
MKNILIMTTFVLVMITAVGLYAEDVCPPLKTGVYRNENYGYTVTIPNGLKGELNSPCTLDDKGDCICIGWHGLTVPLESDAYLDFFAGFSVLEHPSLPDVLRSELINLGLSESDDITVRIRFLQKTLLAGRPAYHFAADYEAQDEKYTKEKIVTIDSENNIEYIITIKAPAKRMQTLKTRFNELVRSWQWIPMGWSVAPSKSITKKKR